MKHHDVASLIEMLKTGKGLKKPGAGHLLRDLAQQIEFSVGQGWSAESWPRWIAVFASMAKRDARTYEAIWMKTPATLRSRVKLEAGKIRAAADLLAQGKSPKIADRIHISEFCQGLMDHTSTW